MISINSRSGEAGVTPMPCGGPRAVGTLRRLLAWGVAASALFAIACNPYRIGGVPATSPSPADPWTPPAMKGRKPDIPGSVIPLEQVREKLGRLTLSEAVDISLHNNPDTKAAWAEAKAAAANYGSAMGAWLPSVNLNGNAVRSNSRLSQGATEGAFDSPVTDYSAAASLSFLLFDFGGRSATIEESRQALLAADWNQNQVIQNTILLTEEAFFNYAEAVALLEANRTSLSEAEANLNAAEERLRLGLATNADVLQAKTARSEVMLAVLGTEGQVRVARGALAVSMGYPANLPYGIETVEPEIPGEGIAETVDRLIEVALASRPELHAVRAAALASEANVKRIQSGMLPSISASGSLGRMWLDGFPGFTDTYSGTLLLQIPLFSGFSRGFDLRGKKAEAMAAQARLRGVEQAVVYQVFSAHSAFLTANERVKTAEDFLTSAGQSAEVAMGRYREGVGSMLDLLSAQKSLAAARAERINARLGWFIALAQLAHDTGILGRQGDNPLTPGAFLSR